MLLMLLSLGRAQEESEAVADSVPVPSWKGAGKLRNHLRNSASRTRYLEASDMEPARTCLSMNTVSLPVCINCIRYVLTFIQLLINSHPPQHINLFINSANELFRPITTIHHYGTVKHIPWTAFTFKWECLNDKHTIIVGCCTDLSML